jgi:hypothetical protein
MDQGSLSKYREALLGVSGIGTPGATPNSTPEVQPQIQNIQNMYKGTFQAGAAKRAIGAVGGAAGAQADQEAAALEKQKQDLLDPSKYRQEIDEQGGYKFFDPQGQEIDIKGFSAATGKHVTDVLKKSQNPYDRQFVQDYKQVEELGSIMQRGDKKALEKLYKKQPGLKETLKGKTYSQIVTDFRKFYPRFFNSTPTAKPQQTTYGNKTTEDIGGGGASLMDRIKGILGS